MIENTPPAQRRPIRAGERWDLGFPAERSITQWERRHEAGEVPGRWPYGLDALSAFADVRPIDLREPGLLSKARSRAGLGIRPVSDAVGITWDENAAWRMSIVAPHASRATGVIWLTDTAARGGEVRGLARVLAGCDVLWALSEAQLEPLSSLVPGPRCEYVRFAIDHEFFTPQPLPPVLRVVSVGGDRDRDTAALFRAFEIIRERMPHVELVAQTTSTLPPPPGVTIVRHLPHARLRDLYASATVVMIATHANLHVSGMTVSLEAMATGRPVTITRTPGMEDYVEEGRTGLLSPVDDPDALAAHTIDLLSDPERVAAMGAAARTVVESRFTPAHMAAQIARIVSGL